MPPFLAVERCKALLSFNLPRWNWKSEGLGAVGYTQLDEVRI